MITYDTYICVTTQRRIDDGERGSYKVHLAEYGDMSELYEALRRCFPTECNPEYRFTEWSGIPEAAISHERILCDVYELFDALEAFGIDDYGHFEQWCFRRGYDPITDDAYMPASQYSERYAKICYAIEDPPDDDDDNETEIDDPYEFYTYTSRTNYETFEDNYD